LPGGWRAAWPDAVSRIVAVPYLPLLTAILLAASAVIQARLASGTVQGPVAGYYPPAALSLALLSLAATLPLGLLWKYPVTAAVVVSVANLLSLAGLHLFTVAGMAAQLLIFYRLGRTGSQLLAVAIAVPYLVCALVIPADQGLFTRGFAVIVASTGPMAGWAGAARRARTQAIEHHTQAQAIAGSLVEHTARGERVRISRELHDVVAHHISMIAVQAETARLATPGMPEAGAQRLSSIGDTARSALTEMRRLLGVLREDADGDGAQRHPQPGIAQLNELLDAARNVSESGARLIVSGWPVAFDPGVELAAYRIVQEALSNARQHAPGSAVDVELDYNDAELRIRIRDNGPGLADQQPAGHGLTGMRERAVAVGGQLRFGTAAGGGLVVEVVLPAKAEVR
jgi:signal transduction histidine kinase